jgi:hypothetical protein
MTQPANKKLVTDADMAPTLARIASLESATGAKSQQVRILCPGDVNRPRQNPDGSALGATQYARWVKATAPANAVVDDEWTVRAF